MEKVMSTWRIRQPSHPKVHRRWSYLSQWGSNGSGDGNSIQGHRRDGNGNVYVADTCTRIQKFSGDGTYLAHWGGTVVGMGSSIGLGGHRCGWVRKCLRGGYVERSHPEVQQ